MLSGDQGVTPDRPPRAAPTPAGRCRGPWVGQSPGEAVVRLGLSGQRGGGAPHGPCDSGHAESRAWSHVAGGGWRGGAWRRAPTQETGRPGWSESHNNNRNDTENRERRDSVIHRHQAPRSPGRFPAHKWPWGGKGEPKLGVPTARVPTGLQPRRTARLHPGVAPPSLLPQGRSGCATVAGQKGISLKRKDLGDI